MQLIRSSSALFLLTLSAALLAGCNPTATAPMNSNAPVLANGKKLPVAQDTVARINVSEAKQAVDSGEAIIVDVRIPNAYAQEHPKGAINLPAAETGSRVGELPKNKLLITSCSCPAEQSSISASQMYKNNGYTNTAALVGGTNAWKAAGFGMSTGDKP
ncbi:MAG: rhodanese-like domain-containing protein [Pyrinomonadaceae bacterium]